MFKFLQLIWYGHLHKWHIIDESDVQDGEELVGTRYTCQCGYCGEIKAFNNYKD